MHLARLLAYFDASPALRLLRSSNAPFILDFLHQQFKHPPRIAVPHAELRAALAAYREGVHNAHPDVLRDAAEAYLAGWCSSETRWLRRLLESDRDEPVYQLTPATEDVLSFLDRALEQETGFVAAESRLKLVTAALSDLAVGASDDPETRLASLRAERDRLDEEIRRIESDGAVACYRPAQVRERFATAVTLLKQLQGDFRAVEEKFRAITRQVQQRLSEGQDARGGILEFALDAEDLLLREDQGVSFSEFVRFLLAPAQQEHLQTTIGRLEQIGAAAGQVEGLDTVRGMAPMLLAEAENVMRTNQRLSATLRRLLDARGRRDRQRTAQLCRDVLALAAAQAADPPRDRVGVEIDGRVGIASPFAHLLAAVAPLRPHPNGRAPRRCGAASEAFRLLARMHRLDWRRMRENVKTAVLRHGSITLGSLLAEHPALAVCEVLAYVQIAHDDGHFVSPAAREEIVLSLSPSQPPIALTVPLVRFIAS